MQPAPKPKQESSRLLALKRYKLLDTESEQSFDDLTLLASTICETPIALISLVDEKRQWFKSKVGLDANETPREMAFCAHAIHGEDPLVVEDTSLDTRFFDNPLVKDDPNIRFYMGAPLITHDGYALGTLCVIDRAPRKLSSQQSQALIALSRLVIDQFELRRLNTQLKKDNANKVHLFSTISHDLRTPFNNLLGYANLLEKNIETYSFDRIKVIGGSMKNAATQAYDMLDNLLNWSRSQLNAIEVSSVELCLRDIFLELRQSSQAFIDEKELNVNVESSISILADRHLMSTVIHNLLMNAVKFTPSGGHIVLGGFNNHGRARVFVQDSGVGMSEERMAHFFEKGMLNTQEGTEGEQGTGLGLMLCDEYLRRMNSSLRIESELGKGSCFWFELPLA